MAALRGGAAVLGLLQQPVDEMCSHSHLQQKPAGNHRARSYMEAFPFNAFN